MDEALWSVEEKLKLTTQEAILLLVCSAFAVIGLCTLAMLRRKAQRKENAVRPGPDPDGVDPGTIRQPEPSSNWVTVRMVLMGSARWSGGSKWEDGRGVGNWDKLRPPVVPPGQTPPAFLGLERCVSNLRQHSHCSVSPVWQRPILMGEKCELPRFSGLILYDERGRLLDQSLTSSQKEHNLEEEHVVALTKTTLQDLF